MITPNIRYYAKMEYDTSSQKTPKYVIKAEAGFYEPMEHIKGRNGFVSMYLMEKLKDGANVPSMRLQAKDSLNFTGLKDYFVDGKLSDKTAATTPDQIRPTFIELIVLEGAKVLIPSYCKQLTMGGFDEAINLLREQAKVL